MPNSTIKGFWAEMSPCEHFVQIYDRQDEFMSTLAAFVADGLAPGNSAVVIASAPHRSELAARLTEMGVDVAAARKRDQLLLLDAEETLARFMVDGWPDRQRFDAVITDVISRATGEDRKIRAFGEMVALMWAKGYCGATVMLEHFWHEMCKQQGFPLFCAYPKSGFTYNAADSIAQICEAHSKVLAA
jgi:hypothetical protein